MPHHIRYRKKWCRQCQQRRGKHGGLPMQTTLRLDWPPSVNRYWRVTAGNRVYLADAGRRYRTAAVQEAMRTGCKSLPIYDETVALSLEFTYPDRRKRDLDNLLKAVLDALGHAGIYRDDSQVKRIYAECVGIESPGCVDVTVSPYGVQILDQ